MAEFRHKNSSAGARKSWQGEAKERWPMLTEELSQRCPANTKARRWMLWDTLLSSSCSPPNANPPSLHQNFAFPVKDLCRKYRYFATPSVQEEKTLFSFSPCLQPSLILKVCKGVKRQFQPLPLWHRDHEKDRRRTWTALTAFPLRGTKQSEPGSPILLGHGERALWKRALSAVLNINAKPSLTS